MYRIKLIAAGGVLLATVHLSAQTSSVGPVRSTPHATSTGAPGAPSPGMAPRLLPGTRAGVLATIQGNTLTSTNGVLPDANVRLRDARIGRIVDSQISDRSGLFAFKAVDPGSYIVEIVSPDQAILAASQMLNVNAGEAVSTIVKLPFRIPPMAGLLGNTTASAIAVTAAAGAAQVLAVAATTSVTP
jgi:hypothetical protein